MAPDPNVYKMSCLFMFISFIWHWWVLNWALLFQIAIINQLKCEVVHVNPIPRRGPSILQPRQSHECGCWEEEEGCWSESRQHGVLVKMTTSHKLLVEEKWGLLVLLNVGVSARLYASLFYFHGHLIQCQVRQKSSYYIIPNNSADLPSKIIVSA